MKTTASYSAPTTTSSTRPSTAGSSLDQEDFTVMVADVSQAVSTYCSKRPRVVAGCIFAMGFIVGWKMRPW
jgi:hypothetical protein